MDREGGVLAKKPGQSEHASAKGEGIKQKNGRGSKEGEGGGPLRSNLIVDKE